MKLLLKGDKKLACNHKGIANLYNLAFLKVMITDKIQKTKNDCTKQQLSPNMAAPRASQTQKKTIATIWIINKSVAQPWI